MNPLAIPLFASLAAIALAIVYELTGLGKEWLQWAVVITIFYGGAFIVTMVAAGVFWLLMPRKPKRDG